MTVFMLMGMMPQMAFADEAVSAQQVRVVVENSIWTEDNGAPWSGTLADESVDITDDTTLISAINAALQKAGQQKLSDSTQHITDVNGIADGDAGEDCKWKVTINDAAALNALSDYTVAAGKIKNGDVVRISYEGFVTAASQPQEQEAADGGQQGDVSEKSSIKTKSASGTVYISISDDAYYVNDTAGSPVANTAVDLADVASIDLAEYGLEDYLYDEDGDGISEITALHLFIYTHENILGLNWNDVMISGDPGSLYFEGGLFGFIDENMTYYYNGTYPAVDGWGLTADQIVLSSNDFLNIAHYTDWSFYFDSKAGFHYFASGDDNIQMSFAAEAGKKCMLKLKRSGGGFGGESIIVGDPGVTVHYGKSYGVSEGSAVTGDDGAFEIVFPSKGTWCVWLDGQIGESVDAIVSAPGFATVNVSETQEAEAQAADPIKAYVTLVNKGEIAAAKKEITVTDRDKSGDFDVDETLYAAHEQLYQGGAEAGYASEVTDYGLSLTKLLGDTSGNYGYWLNDSSCWSLADKVKAEDYLVAFIYKDTNVWDPYTKFQNEKYDTLAEVPVTVTLQKAGYDDSWNTVFSNHNGADLKIYDTSFNEIDAESYKIEDNDDGTYTVVVDTEGNYYLAAYDDSVPVVPAICELTVEVNPDIVPAYIDKIYEDTGKYIASAGTPTVASTGGEWAVIGLTRAEYPVSDEWKSGYYSNVLTFAGKNINDKEQLHKTKSTENSRVILGLTSLGYDVTDVGGHDLLQGLSDFTYVKKQGINGPIWALLAFDSNDYDIPEVADGGDQVTREKLIEYILEKQLAGGGWALSGNNADPDMTGMAIQALAPYYDGNADVKAAVDKALGVLSSLQRDDGGFASWGSVNAESCAQVIVALTSLGINPDTDERFIKNGKSALDAMLAFAADGGGFKHIANGPVNGMATEQAYYALVSYYRLLDGKTPLYDMTDVNGSDEPAVDSEVVNVINLIEAISVPVTQEDENEVKAARAAYDALTDEQKAEVSNYDKLTEAEMILKKLKEEQAAAAEQQNKPAKENNTSSTKVVTKSANIKLKDEKVTEEQLEKGRENHYDSATGIDVSGNSNDILPWYVKITVEEKSLTKKQESEVKKALGEDCKIFMFKDIHFTDTNNGEEWQPGEPIKVRMPAVDMEGYENIVIIHISDDGEIELINAEVKNGMIEFEATGFSLYGIAGTNTSIDEMMTPEAEEPMVWPWILIGAIALVIIAIIAIRRKSVRE